MKLTFLKNIFYLSSILLFVTVCNKQSNAAFGGYFTVDFDINQWELIRKAENKLDEGPVKLLYQMKADQGYFLDITIYNPHDEYSMSSDPDEFFRQTNQSAANKKHNFIQSKTKVINSIHYQDSLFYEKGTLERATFTGHIAKRDYIVLFNLFYNRRASNGAVLYNQESMTLEFEKILSSFKDLSSN